MPWFKVHGKPYLLTKEARGRQLHTRPRQTPRHPRSGAAAMAGPSFTPTQDPTSMSAPPPTPHVALHYSVSTLMLNFIFGPPSPTYYTQMPSMFQTTTDPMTAYRLIESPIVLPSAYGTQYSYTPTPAVSQTPLGSLFYQCGTSSQPLVVRMRIHNGNREANHRRRRRR
ncbi:hypothetical protein Goari_005816 [Gossypium aridum]|uniref:Uncharacterized protein n=1 Tax=Gossypium aridum TaxID=34290 RepID=A0A7J8XL75_GOSAI|nr:hypothetical protein [Gossypium aridum]